MIDLQRWRIIPAGCAALVTVASCSRPPRTVTVPVELDHNRMVVEAELQRRDGSWRSARLWVDSGNPELFLSDALARDLGLDVAPKAGSAPGKPGNQVETSPPSGLRLAGMALDLEGVSSRVLVEPRWLFSTVNIDANLPSTVLQHYRVILDYPQRRLTLALPGSGPPARGARIAAEVNPATGIVQIDVAVAGEPMSVAVDNGASFSFVSEDVVRRLADDHPTWPRHTGALGGANIWGWWPGEAGWPVLRVPEIRCGSVSLNGVALVGLPGFFPDAPSLGAWYSKKTARPVVGFLGPNAFATFAVEIDYPGRSIYLEAGPDPAPPDMDLVGLTLRPEADGGWTVIGVATIDDRPAVPGVAPGDLLLSVDGRRTAGATMGVVVDALRGVPGEVRELVLERDGERFEVEAAVACFLPPGPVASPASDR